MHRMYQIPLDTFRTSVRRTLCSVCGIVFVCCRRAVCDAVCGHLLLSVTDMSGIVIVYTTP